MVSRLKGIETHISGTASRSSRLWIWFPVWRELKQTDTINRTVPIASNFGYGFPFEGNWNPKLGGLHCAEDFSFFGYGFPFEGNWNEILPDVSDTVCAFFGYGFPFEGNWNTLSPDTKVVPAAAFGYGFPFEGNWNFFLLCGCGCVHLTLDMVSRLKGIETGFSFPVAASAVAFGYGFPFEGNWNEND